MPGPDDPRLRDPVPEVTRKERTYLLGVSTAGIVVAHTGLIPSEITTFGIRFAESDQASLLTVSTTGEDLGGYLVGFGEALGLADDGHGERWRVRLSSALSGVCGDKMTEEAARGAEAAEDHTPPPAPDAAGPLSDANRALSDAVDRRERTDGDTPGAAERKHRASVAVAEAGQLVAGEQVRQERERGEAGGQS